MLKYVEIDISCFSSSFCCVLQILRFLYSCVRLSIHGAKNQTNNKKKGTILVSFCSKCASLNILLTRGCWPLPKANGGWTEIDSLFPLCCEQLWCEHVAGCQTTGRCWGSARIDAPLLEFAAVRCGGEGSDCVCRCRELGDFLDTAPPGDSCRHCSTGTTSKTAKLEPL